jgi:predicted nucleic acid-binding Zn ribbon protein
LSERGGEPEPVGEILDRLLRENRILEQESQTELVKAWNDVAGRVVARHSRVHTFRGGVLTVALASAALRQELEVFQRSELLAALRERVRGVRVEDLRFTIM